LKYSVLRNGDQQTPARGAGMNHQCLVAIHNALECHRWISVTVIQRKMFWVFGIAHETFHRWKEDGSKQEINKGYSFSGM
jgi:hypothetical protein